MLSLLSLCRSARAAGALWVVVPAAGPSAVASRRDLSSLPSRFWAAALPAGAMVRAALPAAQWSALFGLPAAPGWWFCFGRGPHAHARALAWSSARGGLVRALYGSWWALVSSAPPAAPAPPPALLRCPCGRLLGSGFCRCGRILSSVVPRALGAGAGVVVVASSRHAPSGLVALCAFPVWSAAAVFARACPGLFGVVPPFVRRAGPGWVVSVPISSRR